MSREEEMGALEEGRFDPEVSDNTVGEGAGGPAMGTMENAVRVLLMGLGEDSEREGLRKTPIRVAKAFREGTRGNNEFVDAFVGYRQKVEDIVQGAFFPEAGLNNGIGHAGGDGGLVVVRDINLFSYCESCLLPFSIKCHVGYIPSGQRVVGLSKLSRVADVYAKRLQEPQRLADEICQALQNSIRPAGVSVALQCWHIQFPKVLKCINLNLPRHPSRSSMQGWVHTSVCSSTGVFEQKKSSFSDDFHTLLQFSGANFDLSNTGCSIHSWCLLRSLDVPESNDDMMRNNLLNGRIFSKPVVSHTSMVAAVASIILSLGEDPSRKELVGTPYRYVHWLMNFSRSNIDIRQNGFLLNAINSHKSSNGYIHRENEINSELNLPFCAQCEHHLLPFHGVVHIGYFHDEEKKDIDRSSLQTMVHFYGCKLQVQERLTRQIAEAVYSVLGRGVMVVLEANHICMVSRGIEKVGSSTATIAVMGQFSTDITAKALFLEAISKVTAAVGP
ncbi:GTP cyclohydrolase 1 [Dendrobium catenatum]|uniref:GTP cyclohydrolase 1 n=1 Tax=Dendrobium catenatum TaxID=906689 RepID=A0A2I0X9T3_9ASPA|nr:GTP cyclohydrolase 1 [Dendrobium catenatum]